MNSDNKDPLWKELADHLRKLNAEFYWKTAGAQHSRSTQWPARPPRPVNKGGISMSMKQEHAPPRIREAGDQGSTQEREQSEQKKDIKDVPKRRLE